MFSYTQLLKDCIIVSFFHNIIEQIVEKGRRGILMEKIEREAWAMREALNFSIKKKNQPNQIKLFFFYLIWHIVLFYRLVIHCWTHTCREIPSPSISWSSCHGTLRVMVWPWPKKTHTMAHAAPCEVLLLHWWPWWSQSYITTTICYNVNEIIGYW